MFLCVYVFFFAQMKATSFISKSFLYLSFSSDWDPKEASSNIIRIYWPGGAPTGPIVLSALWCSWKSWMSPLPQQAPLLSVLSSFTFVEHLLRDAPYKMILYSIYNGSWTSREALQTIGFIAFARAYIHQIKEFFCVFISWWNSDVSWSRTWSLGMKQHTVKSAVKKTP